MRKHFPKAEAVLFMAVLKVIVLEQFLIQAVNYGH
jgi:hypothetical protein